MKKILIIEDEPDVARSIKAFLEAAGYETAFTFDPMEGVKKLKSYDLLLLDLIMPKVSGRMVLKEIKSKGIIIPVIVLSAISLPATVGAELMSQYPGLRFLPKTQMYRDLIPMIRELLGE